MGACLELLPEAAPFAVEVRRESFYIGTGIGDSVMHARRDANGVPAAVSVPLDRAAAFLAALDQVLGHYPRHADSPSRMAARLRPLIDPWAVHVFRPHLVMQGPVILFGVGTRWQPTGTVELCYSDLLPLRDGITAALDEERSCT